jgi:hypothetical protein
MMVTMGWNPFGFQLLEALPKGRNFDAEYSRVKILPEPIQFLPEPGGRQLVVRADNARPLNIAKRFVQKMG